MDPKRLKQMRQIGRLSSHCILDLEMYLLMDCQNKVRYLDFSLFALLTTVPRLLM